MYFIFWHSCLRNKLQGDGNFAWVFTMAFTREHPLFELSGPKINLFFSYPQNVSFALMEENRADLPRGQEKEPDLRLLQ